MKLSATVLCLAALGYAPLQCGSEPDHSLRRNETPGEAVYGLAERFRAQGDEQAWRATLKYLVERYPNSRYAVMAREDLGAGESSPEHEP